MKSVVLLSGGLDSCVSASIAKTKSEELLALTFIYGQKHRKEVLSAKKIGEFLRVKEHKFVNIDPEIFKSSSLTSEQMEIEDRDLDEIGRDIPSTYVPGRNIIFLSYAVAFAESRDADSIFVGVNALDYSGYPDCRPEFIDAFQLAVNAGTKSGVEGRAIKIEAPLIKMSKKEIIETGIKVGAPLELTWSCYRGGEKACGRCDSCKLRLKGFMEAGYRDPLEYETYPEWYDVKKLKPIVFNP